MSTLDTKKYPMRTLWKGWFFKTRYYEGFAQNPHNFHVHYFQIDADWFDSLTDGEKAITYSKEKSAAYYTSLNKAVSR